MDKKKKVIVVTVICVSIIFILLSLFSIIKIIENNKIKASDIDIVVYQKQENNEEIEIFREKFTDDLEINLIIYSKIREDGQNTLIIKDGKCQLIETNCPTHSCEGYLITNKSSIFASATTISCLPNGIYISLESSK